MSAGLDGHGGFLAFVAPRDGSIPLSLRSQGIELAWWSPRD